jgi:GNAT superfamily N-acetyltransferase
MIVSLRPETEDDNAFLRRLITATIVQELGADSWPEPMRTHLTGMQYTMRRQAVRARYPGGESRIILADGVESGWLFSADLPEIVWLVELMVAAEFRGKGIGGLAVRQVIKGAGGRPVHLKVNVTNDGAIRLYERLGFRRIGGDEVQHLMECRAALPC